MAWKYIDCSISELRLDITLTCGQSFRWREVCDGEWRSVLSGCVFTLKQDKQKLYYQIHQENEKGNGPSREKKARLSDPASVLRDYFQLEVNLQKLYEKWSNDDDNFRTLAARFQGVRILRQDPTENIFSFICSSNNNIARITSMVERLCTRYGRKLVEIDGVPYHEFPACEALAQDGVEGELRRSGFGYRAKFIHKTACMLVQERQAGWLEGLRGRPYEHVHAELTKLSGIGAKVADCVCLMSLDQPGACPVDTHVWQVTLKTYMTQLRPRRQVKSLTPAAYKEIGEFYRAKFGEHAGWAQSVLFCSDLKRFQEKKKSKEKS